MVAVIWMFASMIIVASFTAAITASLTVGQISGAGPDDLGPGTRSGRRRRGFGAVEQLGELSDLGARLPDMDEGFQALIDGRIDAFVQDRPLLRYAVREGYQGEIEVLPNEVGRQDYWNCAAAGIVPARAAQPCSAGRRPQPALAQPGGALSGAGGMTYSAACAAPAPSQASSAALARAV